MIDTVITTKLKELKMGISRKRFIKIMAAIAAAGIPKPKRALASEKSDLVVFSSEVALDYAERFVKNNFLPTASVDAPVPIVDIYGQPSGYAVDVVEGGGNSGYILLDVNCPELITSFCFDSGAVGPYEKRKQILKKDADISKSGSPCLLQLSPLDLYLYDEAEGKAIDVDGSIMRPLRKSASTPKTKWTDLMVTLDEAYGSSYTITSQDYIGDYWFATEEQIEHNTGKYACAVTALYTIAGLTWTGSGFLIDTFSDWSCYGQIWNYTHSNLLGTYGSWGGALGSTAKENIGSGFLSFCASRGFTQGYSNKNSPSFSDFVSSVSRAKHSVFTGTITDTKGEASCHAMSVAGWAVLKKNGQAMNTIHVYDSWGSMVFLNYSYSGYRDTYGTFF